MAFDLHLDELKKFKPKLTREKDFFEFWKKTLKESASEPLQAKIEKQTYPVEKIKVFKAQYRGFKNAKISGKYLVPNGTGRFPAILFLHGYNGPHDAISDFLGWVLQGFAVFSIDVRGQTGDTPDSTPYSIGAISGHMTKGILDKNEYYYRGVYADCIRALDFLCQRGEVDSNRIGVMGGSQGGGLTIAVCALDSRPKAGVAEIPFLCNFLRSVDVSGTAPYTEIKGFIRMRSQYEKQVYRTLSYFDGMNLADRIKCPMLLSAGLQDETCPPSGVFSVYNHLKCKKEIATNTFAKHESWNLIRERRLEWIVKYLKG
ncbi:MAG: acetylxylan esterase [Elusimicrobiota bacterium]